MEISQFDYQMYMDEIRRLKEETTDLLLSMELYHQTHSREEFDRWWSGGGRERRYFSCMGRIEQIEGLLSMAKIREEQYPKMRGKL